MGVLTNGQKDEISYSINADNLLAQELSVFILIHKKNSNVKHSRLLKDVLEIKGLWAIDYQSYSWGMSLWTKILNEKWKAEADTNRVINGQNKSRSEIVGKK